jgi:cell pole-organizing protein PopZ
MSETSSQEPTMEEILASIRRIISEDETPGAEAETPARAAPAAVAEPEPEPVAVVAPPEPVAAPVVSAPPPPVPAVEEEEEEELELTQKLDSLGDLDIMDAEEPEPAPQLQPQPIADLVSETVAAAAAASFGHLSASIAMPPSGLTLDDVVRELLRPLLRQWLDANLPTIVQEAVQAEVDRIARSRLR